METQLTMSGKGIPAKMETRFRWYVGQEMITSNLRAFRAPSTPTYETHGHLYWAVLGPFRTKRAALWAERYGLNNPHFQHVEDAERLARFA